MSHAIAIARHGWANKGRLEKSLAVGVLVLFGLQLAISVASAIEIIMRDPLSRDALVQSTLAGLATALGASALVLFQRIDERRLALVIGIAAGAMSMAALFTLLLPALATATHLPTTILAAVAGGALMALLDRALPHRHPQADRPANPPVARTATLLSVAIALHNLPEGFAVAAAAAAGDGSGTALAIALQNVPEGVIVATVLWGAGFGRTTAAVVAIVTGLIEPFGALLGMAWIGSSLSTAPLAMAAAGGAMLFVIGHELIPSAARRLTRGSVAASFAAGFATMTFAAAFF